MRFLIPKPEKCNVKKITNRCKNLNNMTAIISRVYSNNTTGWSHPRECKYDSQLENLLT